MMALAQWSRLTSRRAPPGGGTIPPSSMTAPTSASSSMGRPPSTSCSIEVSCSCPALGSARWSRSCSGCSPTRPPAAPAATRTRREPECCRVLPSRTAPRTRPAPGPGAGTWVSRHPWPCWRSPFSPPPRSPPPSPSRATRSCSVVRNRPGCSSGWTSSRPRTRPFAFRSMWAPSRSPSAWAPDSTVPSMSHPGRGSRRWRWWRSGARPAPRRASSSRGSRSSARPD